MKKTGTCPKCGSREIKGFYTAATESSVGVLLSRWHSATLETLTCAECGYTEFYTNDKGLEKIKSEGKQYSAQKIN